MHAPFSLEFHYLPILKPDDVDICHFNLFMGRLDRLNWIRTSFRLVGTMDRPSNRDQFAFPEQFVDGVFEVRECIEPREFGFDELVEIQSERFGFRGETVDEGRSITVIQCLKTPTHDGVLSSALGSAMH